jgi:hypothetical protein
VISDRLGLGHGPGISKMLGGQAVSAEGPRASRPPLPASRDKRLLSNGTLKMPSPLAALSLWDGPTRRATAGSVAASRRDLVVTPVVRRAAICGTGAAYRVHQEPRVPRPRCSVVLSPQERLTPTCVSLATPRRSRQAPRRTESRIRPGAATDDGVRGRTSGTLARRGSPRWLNLGLVRVTRGREEVGRWLTLNE